MKTPMFVAVLISCGFLLAQAQQPPVSVAPTPVAAAVKSAPVTVTNPASQAPAAPAADPVPPPAAPVKRSAAELEKLVAPIALYPDPLIATLLPASVYPLEIVQAARFVADTNNLAKLDEQPWDENVKAVARVPAVIKKMNDELTWTMELGDAFLAQDKELMDMIQTLRGKAQKAGTLQTTPQQVVTVTNMVVEKTVEQQIVVVTNTVVQIQSSSPSVIYVPTYNPYTVYYPPPAYVYNPIAPLVTFGAGMAMGAIIANNCDWHHGGCYNNNVNVDIDRNVNRNSNVNRNGNVNGARSTSASGARASSTGSPQKWQPDQSRLSKSGSPATANSARSTDARGWGSGGAKPSTGSVGARPSTGTAGARPSAGTPSANRPTASPSASRPSPSPSASRSAPAPSASRASGGSGGSAFSGMSSGSSTRSASTRGSSSRSGGFGGGGGGGRGGGGRGR